MTAARQDAWSDQEDIVLANIVLSHIRDGSTQLKAFEEAGTTLNRTSAACGFRWNSNVRKKYTTEIDLAKEQKKKNKIKGKNSFTPAESHNNNSTVNPNSLADAVDSFKKIETLIASIDEYKRENDELKETISKLQAEQRIEQEQAEQNMKAKQKIQEEFQSLQSLLDQAKNMITQLESTFFDK